MVLSVRRRAIVGRCLNSDLKGNENELLGIERNP